MPVELVCNDVMRWAEQYEGPHAHALICDPPYHLSGGFMGQAWDKDGPDAVAFRPATWQALSRHLLPGAFGACFASSRGWHRLACAIEDAGLLIHPSIFMLGWAQGMGWPKSTKIDTQIDADAGAEREVVGDYGQGFRAVGSGLDG